MGIKTRIAATAVTAVMALSVVPQAALATNLDWQYTDTWTENIRLGGLDRNQTATKIADQLAASQEGSSDTVILTVGRNFPDALAATPLADALDAPVLLNDGGTLNEHTSKWLLDNTPENIVIIGGEPIIPQSVIDQIKKVYVQAQINWAPASKFVPEFVRYAGDDRNETAYQVGARTVAEYYGNEYCESSGVKVTYSAAQIELARQLEWKDLYLADVEAKIAAYEAAKAEYEAAKANMDQALLDLRAAQAAYDQALADLEAITSQLEFVGNLGDLQEDVRTQGEDIALLSDALSATQSDYNLLMSIIDAAIRDGAESTEETSWADLESLYDTPWSEVETVLPALSADIAAVFDAFGGATVGQTRNNANTALANAQAALSSAQLAYAQAVKALTDALAADAANQALAAQIAAASQAVVDAKAALDDASDAYMDAITRYINASRAYAALVDDPTLTPGALADAKLEVQKALDAVVAAADNVPVFLGTGRVFADALTAGPVAADQCGVILLTEPTELPDATQKWLDNAGPRVVAAVGGPAATAAGDEATVSYVGADRFDTAKTINLRYLSDRDVLGIATGYDYPDALTGAAFVANHDGGLLLVNTEVPVPAATRAGVQGGNWDTTVVFGGEGAVSIEVAKAVNDIIAN